MADGRKRFGGRVRVSKKDMEQCSVSHLELRRDQHGIAHVVGLSGGKDSTALALRLQELHPDIPLNLVCTPTGNELPEMVEHWERVEELTGLPLLRLTNGTLESQIQAQRMLPNFRARWCTRLLKLVPMEILSRTFGKVAMYVGLRADEMERGGIFSETVVAIHPFQTPSYRVEGGPGVSIPSLEPERCRAPEWMAEVLPEFGWDWGLEEVVGYLERRQVRIPTRTDCAWCFFQTLAEWYALWKNQPALWAVGVEWEEQMGHTFRSDGRDTWPASLKALGASFAAGRVPRAVSASVMGQQALPFGDLAVWESRESLADGACRVCSL